ncbi:hypothetical protein [Listeria ilorinensis]|uniref:hypothetical protein n=1 Tax=Listeria ilorinensis TaxID=2867439 RepID=UPI001EF45B21|nr:hypothetical protein [Listeria ilorinensis]
MNLNKEEVLAKTGIYSGSVGESPPDKFLYRLAAICFKVLPHIGMCFTPASG